MRYRTGEYTVCRRVRLWHLTGLGSEGIKSLLRHHSTLWVQMLATASSTTVALPFIFTLSPSTFSRTSPPRAEHCRAARAHSSYMIRTHTIRTRSKDLHCCTILHVLHQYFSLSLSLSLWIKTTMCVCVRACVRRTIKYVLVHFKLLPLLCYRQIFMALSLIHIWRCRRAAACRSRWSPYH